MRVLVHDAGRRDTIELRHDDGRWVDERGRTLTFEAMGVVDKTSQSEFCRHYGVRFMTAS
jgi:hypothetical protein